MTTNFKLCKIHNHNGDLSKRWIVTYEFLNPETGKFKSFQKRITPFKTARKRYDAASKYKSETDIKLLRGWNPFQSENKGYTSVLNAVQEVLNKKATYTRLRTITTNRCYVNIFSQWIEKENLSGLNIEQFNFQHCLCFSDFLKVNRKVSNRTHNNYIEGLRNIFNNLFEREYILYNPFKKVKLLPEARNTKAYTESELLLLKEYMPTNDPQMWLVCQFVFYCAIRPAELVKLQIRDFDFTLGKITVPATVSKNRKQSVINVPDQFLIELQKINLEQYPNDNYLFSKNLLPGTDYIFPTRLAERFKKHADKIGLKRKLYELKHTGAGMAIQKGANIKDLQLHLRHSNVNITDVYLRAFSSEPSKDFLNHFPTL